MVSRRAGALSVLGGVHKCGQTVSEEGSVTYVLGFRVARKHVCGARTQTVACWFVLLYSTSEQSGETTAVCVRTIRSSIRVSMYERVKHIPAAIAYQATSTLEFELLQYEHYCVEVK